MVYGKKIMKYSYTKASWPYSIPLWGCTRLLIKKLHKEYSLKYYAPWYVSNFTLYCDLISDEMKRHSVLYFEHMEGHVSEQVAEIMNPSEVERRPKVRYEEHELAEPNLPYYVALFTLRPLLQYNCCRE